MHSKGTAHTGCMRLLPPNTALPYNKLCEEQEFALKQKCGRHRQKPVAVVFIVTDWYRTGRYCMVSRVSTPGCECQHPHEHCAVTLGWLCLPCGGRTFSVTFQLFNSKASLL